MECVNDRANAASGTHELSWEGHRNLINPSVPRPLGLVFKCIRISSSPKVASHSMLRTREMFEIQAVEVVMLLKDFLRCKAQRKSFNQYSEISLAAVI
jgi:hypothetical protein